MCNTNNKIFQQWDWERFKLFNKMLIELFWYLHDREMGEVILYAEQQLEYIAYPNLAQP